MEVESIPLACKANVLPKHLHPIIFVGIQGNEPCSLPYQGSIITILLYANIVDSKGVEPLCYQLPFLRIMSAGGYKSL